MPDDLNIKVTATDAGASSTLQKVAGETTGVGAAAQKAGQAAGELGGKLQSTATAATAAARAQQLLNTDLKAASPAQLQAVEAELKHLAQSGQLAEKELAQVNAKLKEIGAEGGSRLKSVLGGIGGELESLAQKIPGVSQLGAVAGAAVPEVAALAAAVGLAVAALKAFSEKQEHTVKLDTALQQSGQLTDEYREKLQALAGQYGKLMGGSTVWLDTLTRLTQFGADSSNVDRYAAGIKNLAATMDGDVAGASVVFTRALTGHYRQLEMLGYEIDKSLPKQQQLESLLAQFAERGGAQAENRAKTLVASFEKLGHAGGNFLPALGRIIDQMTGVGKVMDLWALGLNYAGSAIGGVTPKLEGMSNKIPTLEQRLRAAAKGAGDAGEAMEGELATGADAAKTSTENLAKDGLDKLAAAFQNLSQQAREAIKALDDAKRRADALDDAELGEDLAKIKAGPGSDAEKAKAEREARERSTARKEKRQDETDAAKIATVERDTASKRSVEYEVRTDANSAQGAVDFQQQQRADAKARYDDARAKRQALPEIPKDANDQASNMARARGSQLDQQMESALKQVQAIDAALPALQARAEATKQTYEKAHADADATAKANASQVKGIREEEDSRHQIQQKQRETRQIEAQADDARRKAAEEAQARAQARKEYERILKSGVGNDGKPLSPTGRQTIADHLDALDNADARAKPVAPDAAPIEARNRRAEQAERRSRILGGVESQGGVTGVSQLPAGSLRTDGVHDALDEFGRTLAAGPGEPAPRQNNQDQAKINALEQKLREVTKRVENLIQRGKGPS